MVWAVVKSIQIGLLSMPWATRMFLVLCTGSFIISLPFKQSFVGALCLNPMSTLMSFQVFRGISYAFVHSDALHLLGNMVAFVSLGSQIEGHVGSVMFALMCGTLVLLVSTGILTYSIFITLALKFSESFYTECIAGLSGVIFSLTVIHAFKFTTSDSFKLFGRVSVPQAVMPWVFLVLVQLLPNASFLAHFTGILLGYAYVHGLLTPFFPTAARITKLEALPAVDWMKKMNGFVPSSEPSVLPLSVSAQAVTEM